VNTSRDPYIPVFLKYMGLSPVYYEIYDPPLTKEVVKRLAPYSYEGTMKTSS
jgi:hypothetical protein